MAQAELLRDGATVRVFDAGELRKTTAIVPAGGDTVYVTGRADRAYPAHPAADEAAGPYSDLLLSIRVIKDAANQHLSDLMAAPASAADDDDDGGEDEAEDEDEEEENEGRSKAPQLRSGDDGHDDAQKKPRTC